LNPNVDAKLAGNTFPCPLKCPQCELNSAVAFAELTVVGAANVVVPAVLVIVAPLTTLKDVDETTCPAVPLPAAAVFVETTTAADVVDETTIVVTGLICPERMDVRTAVLMEAEVTTQSPFKAIATGFSARPKIVWQPRAGTGPKDAAKRWAMKVKRLFAVAGSGEVAPVKSATFCWMKIPLTGKFRQYVTPEASDGFCAGI